MPPQTSMSSDLISCDLDGHYGFQPESKLSWSIHKHPGNE